MQSNHWLQSIMFDIIKGIGTQKTVRKGTLLIRQGELDSSLYFFVTGLAKAFYITRDGRQFIKSFIAENGFISSARAVVEHAPSPFSALCLEDSVVIEVLRRDLLAAVDQQPRFAKDVTSLLLNLAAHKELREYELLCLTPEERYQAFCQRQPELIGRLSQEDIARYIGITPVSLCRIRKRSQQAP